MSGVTFEVECPDCEGTGIGVDAKHLDCPDCTCIVDCERCKGTCLIRVEEAR